MSSVCRICFHEMPRERSGFDQVCPDCRTKGYKELWDPTLEMDIDEPGYGNSNKSL